MDFLAFPEFRVTELKDIGRDSMVEGRYCRKAQVFEVADLRLDGAMRAQLPYDPVAIES